MSEEKVKGCVATARGPLIQGPKEEIQETKEKEVIKMLAKVGKEAPDFEAIAYHQGEFKVIKLSDYRGKWVVLCFYPGDFTFV